MGNFKTGFGKTKSQTANVTPSEIVFFDTVNPSTGGTVFDPNTPQTTDTLYVSSVDASTWIWNGLAYVDYEAPTTDSTPFNLYNTSIDAGGNKTAFISRSGPILINSPNPNYYAGYFYNRAISGVGRGLIVKKDLRTTSGDYLTVQGSNFSTGELQNRLIVTHDGNLEINGVYTLPNVDGAVGQVQKTNGAGVVTWEDAGAKPSVQTVVSTATLTPTSSDDLVEVTAQAEALAIDNPTGTYVNGQTFLIRITDNGTIRAITYGDKYIAFGSALPTATVVGKTILIGCTYNSAGTGTFECLNTIQQ